MVPCLNVQCYVRSYCYGLNKLSYNKLIRVLYYKFSCTLITIRLLRQTFMFLACELLKLLSYVLRAIHTFYMLYYICIQG